MKIVFNENDNLDTIRKIIKILEEIKNPNSNNTEQITLNDPEGKPTEKQIYFLTSHNIVMPEGCTKKQASDLINNYISKNNKGS